MLLYVVDGKIWQVPDMSLSMAQQLVRELKADGQNVTDARYIPNPIKLAV